MARTFAGAVLETLLADARLSFAARRMKNLKIIQDTKEDDGEEETVSLGVNTPIEKIKERSILMKNIEKRKEKELKAYKKINEQVLTTARKYSPDDCKIDYDIEQQILYHLVRSALTINGLLTKAQRTQKWINYCYYFMTNKDAPLLVHIPDSTKALCNGICNIYGFGKMYPNANIANLKIYDCFDPAFGTNPDYVLSIAKLQLNNTAEMQLAIANKKAIDLKVDDNNNAVEEPYNPNKIVPIHFSSPSEINSIIVDSTDVRGNIPDNVIAILNGKIKPIMDSLGEEYYYDKSDYTERVIMTVLRKDGFNETYEFDLSTLGLNQYAMVAPTYSGDKILVPINETDIIKYLLESCFHQIDPATESYLYSKMIKDYTWIYKMVDLGDLDTENIGIEGMNLLAQTINCLFGWCQENNLQIPRVRFASYESYSKFTLVSDMYTRNPLKDIDDVNMLILDGLTMVVDGNNFSYRYQDRCEMVDISIIKKKEAS